jgi:predicted transcriptional regulator
MLSCSTRSSEERYLQRIAEMKGKPGRSVLTSKIETEIDLLQRHVAMLKAIMDNEPIGIIRLSEMLKYPQHKVRYSLRILEQEGLIEPSPDGAVTTEKIQDFLDHLKEILETMSNTVNELRESIE